MLGRTLQYISFWFKSTNEHGVQSPFVYELLTFGIYNQHTWTIEQQQHVKTYISMHQIASWRVVRCWFRMIQHLGYKYIKYYGTASNIRYFKVEENQIFFETKTSATYRDIFAKQKTDLFICNYTDISRNLEKALEILPRLHNRASMIVVRSYQDAHIYQSLIDDPRVTVSIDGFNQLILFVRSEQEKQHFTLRL